MQDSDINWNEVEDAPLLTFEGMEVKAKVTSVYDGDTIKCVFPMKDSNKLYKWNCRLSGVDTPELRTRNKNEKKYGYQVRDNLRGKILNKVVTLKCGKFDKYGRLLVEVSNYCEDDKCTINDWLINNKYAFKYDGGKKSSWEDFLQKEKDLISN